MEAAEFPERELKAGSEADSYLASAAIDAEWFSDEQLAKEVLALDEDLCVIEARRAVMLAEVERRHTGVPSADMVGPFASPSTSRWFADQSRRSQKMAGGIVNDSVRLSELPEVLAAYAASRIRPHHVREILRSHRTQPDTIAAAQSAVVEWAIECEWPEFVKRVRALLELMDDADPTEAALRRFNKRSLHRLKVDDMVTYVLATTPEVSALIEELLAGVVQRLKDQDWAELVATYGDDASWDKAVRTDAQRRHDAWFLLLQSGAVKLDPSGSFVVNVAMDHDTLLREVDRMLGDVEPMEIDEAVQAAEAYLSCSMRREPIPAVIAFRMAIAGHVRRVLYSAADAKIDVSRKTSLFRGLQRLAIMLRHPRCVEPGCDRPSVECEIDHIEPRAREGPTVTMNGAPRCRRCHQWKTMLQLYGLD